MRSSLPLRAITSSNNRLTYLDLDTLFSQAGYESESSIEYQLWYTWARLRKNSNQTDRSG